MEVLVSSDLLGLLHQPPADGVCNEGLALLELPDWEVCGQQCSRDEAGCPMPDLLTCRESICVIAEPW